MTEDRASAAGALGPPLLETRGDYDWLNGLRHDIVRWRQSDPAGDGPSSRETSWRSPRNAYKRPPFRPLLKLVLDSATQAFREQGHAGNSPVAVDSMWANVMEAGGHHVLHVDTEAHWSGVFWVQAPENSPGVVFLDPRGSVSPVPSHGSGRGQERVRVAAEAGKLVMFPSSLPHYVEPSPADRISVSFNVRQLMAAPTRKGPPYVLVRRLLSTGDIARFYRLFSDDKWRAAKTSSGRSKHRNHDVQFLPVWADLQWRWLHDLVRDSVAATNAATWRRDISGGARWFQVARYGPGERYGPHVDTDGESARVSRRTVTCTITLRTAEQGGGTGFPRAREQPCTAAGDAVIFPADELHEGIEVVRGTRDVLVAWFKSARES